MRRSQERSRCLHHLYKMHTDVVVPQHGRLWSAMRTAVIQRTFVQCSHNMPPQHVTGSQDEFRKKWETGGRAGKECGNT